MNDDCDWPAGFDQGYDLRDSRLHEPATDDFPMRPPPPPSRRRRRYNDERGRLKRALSRATGSVLVDEKLYAKY